METSSGILRFSDSPVSDERFCTATTRRNRKRLRPRETQRSRSSSLGIWIMLATVVLRHTAAWSSRGAHRAAVSSACSMSSRQSSSFSNACSTVRRQPAQSSVLQFSMMAADSRELRFFGAAISSPASDNRFFCSSSYSTLAKATTTMIIEPPLISKHVINGENADSSGLDAESSSRYSSRWFSSNTNDQQQPQEGQDMPPSSPSSVTVTDSVSSKLPPRQGYGTSLRLTAEEKQLFSLLRHVREDMNLTTTLRVAGGWVRDKLLATDEFQVYHRVFDVGTDDLQQRRLTSKFQKHSPTSMGRMGTKVLVNSEKQCQPVDIDIALDDMLGREFADRLNDYLSSQGKDTVSVGVVLKNPEKSKHLETATMKVGSFWIDFVNLRAEEYTQDSRIPDLMRIGSASEDAFRRDLTINALFYNINTGEVEDWSGRGFDDLKQGVVATPLPPLTTLLDDPLRVLRSIRFAARLRFTMDDELVAAAMDHRVRNSLAQKVSRERVGGEVDLMLRSPDPVGAMRLLVNLVLADTVFPVDKHITIDEDNSHTSVKGTDLLNQGLELLSTAHDHLADCRLSPPIWCMKTIPILNAQEVRLTQDQEARRLLWYASFLKPLYDFSQQQQSHQTRQSRRKGKKANRSLIVKLLVDDLKRPIREAEAVERIIKAADDFTKILNSGYDISATMILLSDVKVAYKQTTASKEEHGEFVCSMNGRSVDSAIEEDPVWEHAMEFRLLCSKVMHRIGPLWRAALLLSISEQLASLDDDGLDYAIEGDFVGESHEERRLGVVERFDAFATALQQVGLIGIWNDKPLLDGGMVKKILPNLPKGPIFRDVMDEQMKWMTAHPDGDEHALRIHLTNVYLDFAEKHPTS